jgi:hypothetical protein
VGLYQDFTIVDCGEPERKYQAQEPLPLAKSKEDDIIVAVFCSQARRVWQLMEYRIRAPGK